MELFCRITLKHPFVFLQAIATIFALHMLWIELDDKFLYISSLSNIFMILSHGFMILSRGKC